MFQLLTDTTIHLKAEADRLVMGNSSLKPSQIMTVSRRSRDSHKYLHKMGINSQRGRKETATLDLDPAHQGFKFADSTQSKLTIAKPLQEASAAIRDHSGLNFKSRYPQSRIKTENQKASSSLRKTELDLKAPLGNGNGGTMSSTSNYSNGYFNKKHKQ